MKKALSILLALTLCMALAIPALAAEVKSDMHTYTLSNEVLGTTTVVWSESVFDEDGQLVLDEDGVPVSADVEHTVYLVPAGTVVTNNDLFLSYAVYLYDEAEGAYDAGELKESVKSLTIESIDSYDPDGTYSDLLYCVGTLSEDMQEEGALEPAEDKGVYLKAADPSEVPETEPSEDPAPETGEDPAPGASEETTPAPAPAVIPTNQNLTVNGEAKETEIYNIDGYNYFKLRDIAALLTDTGSQFNVAFDAERDTVVVTKGEAYEVQEGDLALGTDKSATTVASAQSIEIDGEKVELTAYNIGGNNFFKLRELGEALDFEVEYDEDTATMVVTSK